jgi:acyl-CoA hydrolase
VSRKSRGLGYYKKTSIYSIMPNDLNAQKTIFGGVIASQVDKLAASIAKEYSNRSNVVTVASYISFYNPAYEGEDLEIRGKLIYVGNTSMGILVDIKAKNYASKKTRDIAKAYLVFVAKDESGKVISLPQPQLTKKEKELYEKGKTLKEMAIKFSEMLYTI